MRNIRWIVEITNLSYINQSKIINENFLLKGERKNILSLIIMKQETKFKRI